MMRFFIFGLSMAVSNVICSLFTEGIMGYINLIIGCLCFFCAGMQLQEIADKIKNKDTD